MSRYNYYHYFEPSRPIETDKGIKARSKRGAFAKTWWASRWITALEQLVDPGRLRRGRNYARRGQVLSIAESHAGITATVQGSQQTPYRVTIEIKKLSDAQWDHVFDALGEQAIFSAQLLAGEMPQEIEEAFEAAKGNVRLAFCRTCSHIFNSAFDADLVEYSHSYENSLHFSPTFQAYARTLANRLIQKYELYHKNVIEIGCGKGDFLKNSSVESLRNEMKQTPNIRFD